MAGAGYKLFNTGDVLTAAQVNTYLQEQTVMVFADATARTTALSGVLAEGMVTYLKDTNAIEKYTGAAWVNIDSGSTSPLTTKGDLYTYSTADARLAVGNNGEILVPDSSTSTGLRWQGNFAAGKNKIINGDFNINQRNFTSNTTTNTYNFDRFLQANGGSSGTLTITPQTFTPGSAPLSGYEARNFVRCVTASGASTNTYAIFQQTIESVRTLAGQTATISFWAKAGSGTPKIAVEMEQYFGSGGSPSASVTTYAGQVTLSTSWARYSVTVSIPSISGKTIGTSTNDLLLLSLWLSGGSDFNARTGSLGLQNATFDIWGVQVEAGSVATAFQTATGTLAGELAACQRYYYRVDSKVNYSPFAFGSGTSTTAAVFLWRLPVTMRTSPTSVDYSTLSVQDAVSYNSVPTSLTVNYYNTDILFITANGITGATQFRPYFLLANNSTAAYLAVSAEL